MIGETSALQARTEVRAPGYVRAVDARAGFRSGTPGRRAQDAQAQEFSARMRAPILDLRAANRQTARDPQPLETGSAPGSASVQGATSAGTIAMAAGLRAPVSGASDGRNLLRRLDVNEAYLSAETLDGPFAHRGSIFDLQI